MPIPTDPLLASQWHLGNTGGLFDLNVRGVWNPASGLAYTGAGIRVVVIDNGFDFNHSDLAPNYDTSLDFDFETNTFSAAPQAGDNHGTAVMGIIGADNNGTGAVGVAFDTSLVGYRTANLISDAWLQDVRDAIHFAAVNAQGDVANISLAISNDTASEFGFGYNAVRFDEIETSIGDAVNLGRGGLGMTITKAAGNQRAADFDVNADDWSNDTRQVVVAAVDQNGFVSSYSSYGAALLVSGFGTPGEVVTTDRTGAPGYNGTDFTFSFNGTSAAAPMVAGVVSLIYDANPDLGWRDVQSILADSARHVGSAIGSGPTGSERYLWQFNGADTWNGGGLHFSNDYGYGLVDALAAVRLAESWLPTFSAQSSGNQFTNTMDMLNASVVIPDGNATGTSFTGNASFNDEVERVTVALTFSTTFTADLELYVTSPQGTVSELIDDTGGTTDFNGTWTFETQTFRGERAAGTWTVRIVDDSGFDVLTVSDIVVMTWGRDSTDDRYVYTNEFATYAGLFGHSITLTDTNGGTDTLNAAAVTTGSTINLGMGASSVIAGRSLLIGSTTLIENAYGGDGADTITGNSAANQLFGGRGDDTLDGLTASDVLSGGAGNDTFVYSSGYGVDSITDFVFGVGIADRINLLGVSSVHSLSDVLGISSQVGADTVINFGGSNTLTLSNVNRTSLASDDFVFAAPAGLSINDQTISEGDSGTKVMTFTVTRTGGTAAFDVNFATSNGSATVADGDYLANSGTLHFGDNVNTQTISVTINGDTKVEPDEAFFVNLSGATNGATITDGQGQGTIQNDDQAAVQIDNQTTHVQTFGGTPYNGPVAGLQYQYIDLSKDNLNVTGLVPNGFIHTGSGFDAIDVSKVSGINVLDGGTNSNFLVGGTAAGSFDTFFVDNRSPPGDIWSTVANFHKGDDATVWGVTQAGFNLAFANGEGAAGFTGLTLHVTKPGAPTASLTLAGYTTADLTNGKLSTTFGSVGGSDYFFVHAN